MCALTGKQDPVEELPPARGRASEHAKVFGCEQHGTNAALAALGAGRASGPYRVWLRCRIPGSVLILLGFRLLWQEG